MRGWSAYVGRSSASARRAVEERRHGAVGEVVLAGGVAEPRADGRQLGEARGSARRSSMPSARMIVAAGSSSSTMTTTGPASARHVDVADVAGRAAGDQLGGRAEEQERCRRTTGWPRRGRRRAAGRPWSAARARRCRRRRAAPGGRRRRAGRPRSCAALRGRTPSPARPQTAMNTTVPTRRSIDVASAVSADADERRDDRDRPGRTRTICARAVVAGDEELGVVAEQVEQRLGHREGAEPEDHERSRAA